MQKTNGLNTMFDDILADNAVNFIEGLPHAKGDLRGKEIQLAPFWKDEVIRPVFGTLKADGSRQYRTAYIEIPKKSAKSTIASGIALKLLFEEKGGEIYSVATTRKQAAIVFGTAAEMVRQTPKLAKRCKIIDSVKRIVMPRSASFYQVLSSDVKSAHGDNWNGLIFDEFHAQPNFRLYEAVQYGGVSRRQPLMFIITTAGEVCDGVGWSMHTKALSVAQDQSLDPQFFSCIKAANPAVDDLNSEEVWKRVNPMLGYSLDLDEMRQSWKAAKSFPGGMENFYRLRLNTWGRSEGQFLDMDAWAACTDIDKKSLEGRPCFAGLDLGDSEDVSGLTLIFPEEDGGISILPYAWVPEAAAEKTRSRMVNYMPWINSGLMQMTEGDTADHEAIEKSILELAATYEIQELAVDPYHSAQLVQHLEAAGITCVKVAVSYKNMNPAMRELWRMVKQHKVHHGHNPMLTWMAHNLVARKDLYDNVLPDKKKSTGKIDLMSALCLGINRMMANQGEPDFWQAETGDSPQPITGDFWDAKVKEYAAEDKKGKGNA